MFPEIAPLPLGVLKVPFDPGQDLPRPRALGASIAASLSLDNAVLDGELVCLDEDGKSIFSTLHRRRENRERWEWGTECARPRRPPGRRVDLPQGPVRTTDLACYRH